MIVTAMRAATSPCVLSGKRAISNTQGMAAAMLLAAIAQGAAAVAVLVTGWGAHEPPGLVRLVMLISGFAVMWLLSAILFDRAARAQGIAG